MIHKSRNQQILWSSLTSTFKDVLYYYWNKKQMKLENKVEKAHPPSIISLPKAHDTGGRKGKGSFIKAYQLCICFHARHDTSCKCSMLPFKGEKTITEAGSLPWQHLRNMRQNFSNAAGYWARDFQKSFIALFPCNSCTYFDYLVAIISSFL